MAHETFLQPIRQSKSVPSNLIKSHPGSCQNPSGSTSFTMERRDRFVQELDSSGITVYDEDKIAKFVDQFKKCRAPNFDAIQRKLRQDLAEDKNNIAKKWKSAKAKFDKNPTALRNSIKRSDGYDFPDECHIALILYSLDGNGSIYQSFNKDCRSACAKGKGLKTIPNLSLFLLIRYVMEEKTAATEPSHLWRGCRGKPDNIHVGSFIGFGQFTSTTADETTGNNFSGDEGTTFVIVNSSTERTKLIPMKSHSVFPSEKELLLSPFQLYRVQEIDDTSDHIQVYLQLY